MNYPERSSNCSIRPTAATPLKTILAQSIVAACVIGQDEEAVTRCVAGAGKAREDAVVFLQFRVSVLASGDLSGNTMAEQLSRSVMHQATMSRKSASSRKRE